MEAAMLEYIEKYFLFYWSMFILFCGGLFIGSEIRLMQLDKTHRAYEVYLDLVKDECNLKIAEARGLK
jgi:hypothetical protein